MDKLAQQQITDTYYNFGVELALGSMTKTSASVKDVAKAIARVPAYTLPTVGGLSGAVGGGLLAGKLGEGYLTKELMEALAHMDLSSGLKTLALGGAGIGLGAGLGGVGGYQVGKGTKNIILRALNKA